MRWAVSQEPGSKYKSAHTRQLRTYAPIFLRIAGYGRLSGGAVEMHRTILMEYPVYQGKNSEKMQFRTCRKAPFLLQSRGIPAYF
jgi:hypothetical protein